MDNRVKVAAGFILGAATGAVVGYLTAPASGRETRKMIADRAGELSDELRTKAEANLDELRSKYNDTLDKAADKSKKSIENIKSAVSAN